MLFPLSDDPGRSVEQGEVRTGGATGRRPWVVAAAILLVMAALGARSCGSSGPESSSPVTTSTEVGPATSDGAVITSAPERATSTTAPVFPDRITLPEGLRGVLAVLTAGGDLYRVDLHTGASRLVVAGLEGVGFGGPAAVAVLGDATLVLAAERDGLRLVRPDGSTLLDVGPSGAQVVGIGPAGAVVRSWSAERPALTVVSPTGEHATFELPALANVVGAANGQPVVEVLGRIGRLDPADGRLVEVATGRAFAANDWGLVRAVCPTIDRCELHSGPWDDLDRRSVPLPDAVWFESVLDPTGERLAVIAQQHGPPRRVVVDLTTGERTDLGDISSSWEVAFTLDGGHVLLREDEGLVVVRLSDGLRTTLPQFPFDVIGFAVG